MTVSGVCYIQQVAFDLLFVEKRNRVCINGGLWIILFMMGKVSNAGLMFKILYYINKIR